MAADFNWAVGGEAGDGIDSTGKIFAQALSRAGRHVFTSKDFASRIRGGYTAYKVRTSVDKVQSVVDRLDVLIALTPRTIEENLAELHEGSVIIYDGERTTMQNVEIPEEMVGIDVPLKRLAEEAGGAIMRNVVALGAVCEVADFPVEYLDESLEKRFGDKGERIVENNKQAARLGAEYVAEEFEETFPYELETTDEDYLLMNGDEAIGLGAIAGGCRFYAGYPITPAANVMRSGPSTGMPTKQEQGDLNMMLYGGHGEIPRFVLTPTTIAETFHKTVEAFNLAEKYQLPVYLTSDLALAVTEQTYSPEEFDMDAVEIERGN